MAGHSKWANIKHRKSRQDARRGKVFTKLIREITIAARSGSNPTDNPRLRLAVARALTANMTRDTIDRAIAKGSGMTDNNNLEEISYEGYGPGGVAVLIETMTDNRNRTVAEVRHAFTKCNGNMGSTGSVAWLFDRKGEIRLAQGRCDEEKLLDICLAAGTDDLLEEDGELVISCAPEAFSGLCDALEQAGITPAEAEIRMIPSSEVEVDTDTAQLLLKMLDMLEDLDDSQNVYHNASISDVVLAELNS